MIQEPVRVRLELESHPENVALVRAALTGIAEAVQLSDELTADLKTALSEACNNVALHAYGDGSGPMIVEIDGTQEGVGAVVIDHGHGITRISAAEDRMGLGLAVISALADRSEFRRPQGGGTEVRMWFSTEGEPSAEPVSAVTPGREASTSLVAAQQLDGEVLAWFTPVELMRYILGRLIQALAAAAHFSVTKLADLRAANVAISEYVETAADGAVGVAVSSQPRRLTVVSGPLPANDPDAAHKVLATVVDSVTSGTDTIQVELLDHSRGPVR